MDYSLASYESYGCFYELGVIFVRVLSNKMPWGSMRLCDSLETPIWRGAISRRQHTEKDCAQGDVRSPTRELAENLDVAPVVVNLSRYYGTFVRAVLENVLDGY